MTHPITKKVLFKLSNFYPYGQAGKRPRKQGGIAPVLICPTCQTGKRRQFFLRDFPVFAFPALDQWRVFQGFKSVMPAHFNDFPPCLVVCADILCYFFSPMPLRFVEIAFADHPPSFNKDNQGFTGFTNLFLCELQIIQQLRERQIHHFQLSCSRAQVSHAGFMPVRVYGNDIVILLHPCFPPDKQ